MRNTVPDVAKLWGNALQHLADEHMKFALNSSLDTLPHNANLYLWKRKVSEACHLCGERQTLIHVLNACSVAKNSRRYNICHDAVLQDIVNNITKALPSTVKMTSDLAHYTFSHHIIATD